MKTKAFLPAIVFLLASLASCNSSVPKSLVTDDGSVRIIENPDGPLYICDLKAAGDTIDIPLSELVEDCRIVRFETSDEALFKAWWIEVTAIQRGQAIRQGRKIPLQHRCNGKRTGRVSGDYLRREYRRTRRPYIPLSLLWEENHDVRP